MALFKKKTKAKKRKILIAEDSDFQRSILKAIVESEPTFKVLEARDGEEAWKIIEKVSDANRSSLPPATKSRNLIYC